MWFDLWPTGHWSQSFPSATYMYFYSWVWLWKLWNFIYIGMLKFNIHYLLNWTKWDLKRLFSIINKWDSLLYYFCQGIKKISPISTQHVPISFDSVSLILFPWNKKIKFIVTLHTWWPDVLCHLLVFYCSIHAWIETSQWISGNRNWESENRWIWRDCWHVWVLQFSYSIFYLLQDRNRSKFIDCFGAEIQIFPAI